MNTEQFRRHCNQILKLGRINIKKKVGASFPATNSKAATALAGKKNNADITKAKYVIFNFTNKHPKPLKLIYKKHYIEEVTLKYSGKKAYAQLTKAQEQGCLTCNSK